VNEKTVSYDSSSEGAQPMTHKRARSLQDVFRVSSLGALTPAEKRYYVDLDDVRGGKDTSEILFNRIKYKQPSFSYQLFTGHRGCGKSTELLRLKEKLVANGFEVVYFESDQDLDINDVRYSFSFR
jgi:predicted AAA+ superfamily ATPase